MIEFVKFKVTLEKFNNFFKDYIPKLEDLEKKEKTELDCSRKYTDEYLRSYINDQARLFNHLINELQYDCSFLLSNNIPNIFGLVVVGTTIETKVDAKNYFETIEQIRNNCNKYEELKNKITKISFDENKINKDALDEMFQSITKEKKCPDFGQLEIINDEDIKNMMQEFYNLNITTKALAMGVITFLGAEKFIDKESTETFDENDFSWVKENNPMLVYLKNKLKANKEEVEDTIKNSYSQAKENLQNSLVKFYEKDCAPFLEDNHRFLTTDFHTLKTVDLPFSFDNDFNIGSIPHEIKDFDSYKDVVKPVDRLGLLNKQMKYPVYIDLKKKGNVFINTDINDAKVVDFVHQLIMQFILTCPTKKMNLTLIDVDGDSEYDLVMNYSKDYLDSNHLLFPNGIVTEAEQVKDAISELSKKYTEIKGNRLARANLDNIFDYNAANPDNSQEAYLMVYVNYPKNMDPNQAEKFTSLLRNGPKCGIYSIVINNTNIPVSTESYGYNEEMHKGILKAIKEISYCFDFSKVKKSFVYLDKEFTPNYCLTGQNINDFFKKLSEIDKDKSRVKPFFLDEMLQIEYEKPDYFDIIKIPVGKTGEGPVFFELEVGGTGSSCVIGGGTGSGKTSFLHTLVLSGSYFYSPEELEFYLIDFKDGVEFSNYADREHGINVPHVSYLSLQNRVEDAYDLLSKLYNEKEQRNKLFIKAGCSDIRGYMESIPVKTGKLPPLKRLIVIIDEYQNFIDSKDNPILSNKCNDLLTKLLKEIRSSGISLVLCSQDISLDQECKNQILNKYMFKATPIALSAAFPGADTEDMAKQLQTDIGLVYKTKDINGEKNTLFKFAWTGETNKSHQRGIAEQINEKWAKYPYEKPIISGNQEPLLLQEGCADFIKFNKTEIEDEDVITTIVGQSPLSNLPLGINFSTLEMSSYVILGNMKKARNIEASIGLSFLYALRCQDYDCSEKNLTYIDLSIATDALKYISAFEEYQDTLSDVMNYGSCSDVDKVRQLINDMYDEYQRRIEASKARQRILKTPKLLMINSFSCLKDYESDEDSNAESSSGDGLLDDLNGLISDMNTKKDKDATLIDKVVTLYLHGYEQNIFVVLHDRQAKNFDESDRFVDFSRVVCCDSKEIERCLTSVDGSHASVFEIPETYGLLFPNVSKVRPYIFEFNKNMEEYLNKLKGELLDGE